MIINENSIKKLYHSLKDPLRYLRLNKGYKKQLKQNECFKEIYKGERCFILGNGPSLNLYDLEVLQNEKVFCVNELVRDEKLIKKIKPDFYLLADPVFFRLHKNIKEEAELIQKIKNLKNYNPHLQFFLPLDFEEDVRKYGWDEEFNCNYFFPGYILSDNYKKQLDFTYIIPQAQAVVQYAIMLAVYMGFEDIYLLGTDQTNIFGHLKAYLDSEEISEYAFDMTDKERKWKNKKLTQNSLQCTLRGYARIFEIYDQLGVYCKRKGINIKNCSPETMIQGIEKEDFNYVIKEKEKKDVQ